MNFGFDFGADYDQSTSKHIPIRQQFDLNATVDEDDFTNDELKRLLCRLEVDLKSKEEDVAKLKAERTSALLYDAKYGKLCVNDPFFALKRDSVAVEEVLDERQIGQLYESQLLQLEKLISVQRRTHNRAKSLLAAAEKRHAKALRELELEKERKSRFAEIGDDVLALLEKERNKLTQQLEFQIAEVSSCQEQQSRLERQMELEKEKNKAMVLFLINERKQLLVKVHELRLKSENQPEPVPAAQNELLEQLKKEVGFLRQERDILQKDNKALKAENLSLKEVINEQDSDLAALRRTNALSHNKGPYEKSSTATTLPHLVDDSRSSTAFVVANRMATTAPSSAPSTSSGPRTRLANSSSFPTERSRLPRAPSSPAPGRTAVSARAPPSPTKKTMPAMGLGGTGRHRLPPPAMEPELQQLDAAIRSMNVDGANVAPSSPSKRSSSLPRSESRKKSESTSAGYKTEPRPPPPQMGSRIVPPSRVSVDSSSRKLSGTVKRNGMSVLTKAFGK